MYRWGQLSTFSVYHGFWHGGDLLVWEVEGQRGRRVECEVEGWRGWSVLERDGRWVCVGEVEGLNGKWEGVWESEKGLR